MLFMDGDPVGQIEYAPAEASPYPISGDDVWVMSCIWVLRRAKGHHFGRMLMRRMVNSLGDASGIATVGLEGHPSPWLRVPQVEYLGFRPLGSAGMRHKVKHRGLFQDAFDVDAFEGRCRATRDGLEGAAEGS